jgi:predicted ester cyclase
MHHHDASMSDTSANKAVVRRHLEEAVNLKRPELWDEIMSEDFTLHHPLAERPGRSLYLEGLATLWAGFPDIKVEILDLVAEGDRVVARYLERGTHLGDYMGRAPTGRSYQKQGFALYRLSGGRLVEVWMQEDDLGYQKQLFG